MNDMAWIALTLVFGILLGWFVHQLVSRARSDVREERGKADLALAKAETAKAESDLAKSQADIERTRADAERARKELAQSQAELARQEAVTSKVEVERDSALEQALALRADREVMLNQYKSLSADALEKQTRVVEDSANARLKATEQLMVPMRAELERLEARLADMDNQRASMTATMTEQVRTLQTSNDQLRQQTASLVTALRKPQVRGAWGELQLKRVVEVAGMLDHCDFTTQEATTTDERGIRPDMKVWLAGGKFIYVDAKTPLDAFLTACQSDDDDEKAKELVHFARHVRTHIDQLASKAYWKAEVGTPEFVVLFLPSEALASTALEQAPDLIEYGASKNIVLATPTTLIAMLRTISYAWSQEVLADSAREISQLGRELYERLGTLGSHIDTLGHALTSSVTAYNKAVSSLESRVLVSARRFRDLKVSESDLITIAPLDAQPKQITASELVESTPDVTGMIGRSLTVLRPALDDDALSPVADLPSAAHTR